MKVIRLELTQNLANFRKPMNYQIKESYPFPPYSTVIGMIHKACGFTKYHPMDISIQGTTNYSISDIYTSYAFSNGASYERGRHNIKIHTKDKDYGVIRGVGNIELVQELHLILHIKPSDESELEYIYNKLLNPEVYLALGRHEDLIDIQSVSIEECEFRERIYATNLIYVPVDLATVKGTIYKLPKEFYINEKTGLRQFKEPIKVSLVGEEDAIKNVYVDSKNDPVVLC